MAPRGLKTLLKETMPCRLVGSGENKRFETQPPGGGRGVALKGVTKRLGARIFSDGYMPHIARASDAPGGRPFGGVPAAAGAAPRPTRSARAWPA